MTIGAKCRQALLVWLALAQHSWAWAESSPAEGLRADYQKLVRGGADGQISSSLRIQSMEDHERVSGWVQVLVSSQFEELKAALSHPEVWCEVLALHLNTRSWLVAGGPDATALLVRMGPLHGDPVGRPFELILRWGSPLRTRILPGGALGERRTARDERILDPVAGHPRFRRRKLRHSSYSLRYNLASRLALGAYLAGPASRKVGFTTVGSPGSAPGLVSGLRGIVERNAMRYYLGIEAWLATARLPDGRRFQARIETWFDATEKYPRQLHEVGREEYLRMKIHERGSGSAR
jgi:hypothetical protein